LRLEAGFPLYGHELTDETNPLCTPYSWVVKAQKEFFGKEVMLQVRCERRLVGLLVEGGIPREGYRLLRDGREVGYLTSGTHSPVLRKGIGMGYVEADWSEPGTRLEAEVRGKLLAATVVEAPFVKR
jgi:aminomethyltransferase